MRLNIFKDDLANRINENKLLKFALIVISAASLLSSYFSLQAVRFQKTIIIPAGFDSRVVVHGSHLDDNYLKHFTKYSLNLLFSYTPANFEDQANDFLKLCTPGFYPAMRAKLLKMKQSITRLKITSSYFPKEIEVNRKAHEIYVEGLRSQSAQGREMENENKKYVIKYKILNGRFYIDDTQEIKAKK